MQSNQHNHHRFATWCVLCVTIFASPSWGNFLSAVEGAGELAAISALTHQVTGGATLPTNQMAGGYGGGYGGGMGGFGLPWGQGGQGFGMAGGYGGQGMAGNAMGGGYGAYGGY